MMILGPVRSIRRPTLGARTAPTANRTVMPANTSSLGMLRSSWMRRPSNDGMRNVVPQPTIWVKPRPATARVVGVSVTSRVSSGFGLFGIEGKKARFTGGTDTPLRDQRRHQPRGCDIERRIGGRATFREDVDGDDLARRGAARHTRDLE